MTDLSTVLKDQVNAVLSNIKHYQEAEDYFEGNIPETFATIKLRRAFRHTAEFGRLNYCRPIVNAVNDRLQIASVVGDTAKANKAIGAIWDDNNLELESQELHQRALEYGDAYAIAWPDADGDVQITYSSPKTTSVVYDPENGRDKLYAVKLWTAGQTSRLNVYLPDGIYKYSAETEEPSESTSWVFLERVENPWGVIPVFHFRTKRPHGMPEHYDAYSAQNHINKLFITNAWTIDYQGAPQRYALSNAVESDLNDWEDAEPDRQSAGALKNGPGEMWLLKGFSSVGEFKPADPDQFWKPLKDTVRSMASITNTPMHYFDSSQRITTGQAFRAAEAPLMKKVRDRQASFGATWRELWKFVLTMEGIKSDVSVKWINLESTDALDDWDVMLKKINAGLSHRQALREAGYDDTLIEKIMQERDAEAAAGQYYQRKPAARVNLNANENYEDVDEDETQTSGTPEA